MSSQTWQATRMQIRLMDGIVSYCTLFGMKNTKQGENIEKVKKGQTWKRSYHFSINSTF